MKYTNRSITDVGKVRFANEDAIGDALTPNGHLFIVCDGMGGHVGGSVASIRAVECLIEFFQKDNYDNPIQALDHALSFANEQIYAASIIQPELKGMGTTAVTLLIHNEACFIAHVGDSRIYLFSDGKLNRLTKDHSYVQTLVDANIITDQDAENHPNKNQILQALGIAPVVKSTVCSSPILPKKGDVFLLCSDGLNGMVNDREIERLLNHYPLEVCSQMLVSAALEAGGEDNVTVSLIEISESANNKSSFVNFNPKSVDNFDKTNELLIDEVIPPSETKRSLPKSKKRMFILASFGFILSTLSFLAVFFFSKSEDSTKITIPVTDIKTQIKDTILTGDALQKLMMISQCDSAALLKLDNKPCKNLLDTIYRDTCSGFNTEVEVKSEVIDIRIIRYLKTDNTKFGTLGAIAQEFSRTCGKVSVAEIIEYNIKYNSELNFKDKKLLENQKIDKGWKILCPPCKSN